MTNDESSIWPKPDPEIGLTDPYLHLSIGAAATLSGLAESTIRKWIRTGKIKARGYRGTLRVSLYEVLPEHDPTAPTRYGQGCKRAWAKQKETGSGPHSPLKLEVIVCVRGVISPLLANLYMNRFLKYWRITGRVRFFKPRS